MRGATKWMARGLRREAHQAAVEVVEVKIVPLRERVHSMVIDPALISGAAPDEVADSALLDTPMQRDRSIA